MDTDVLKFKNPFSAIVSGPSFSGKTVWVRRLLKNYLLLTDIKTPRLKVLWIYGIEQASHKQPIENVDIMYSSVLPTEDDLKRLRPQVVVLDDIMDIASDSKTVSQIFTRSAHHLNFSVILIVQNFFNKGKVMRTISLNTQYIVMYKNPRDQLQAMTLGRQIFPNDLKYFIEAYEDSTSNPYSYLLVDLKSSTDNDMRLRSRVLPEESDIKGQWRPIIYKRKQRKHVFKPSFRPSFA